MENISKEKKEKEEIEKEQKKEKDFQKKLEDNKLKIMATFKKINTSTSDGIIPKIKHHNRLVNNLFKLLLGEKKDEKNHNNFKKIPKIKLLKSSKSSFDISHVSQNVKKLSRKINFKVNKVKKSHEDLIALNSLYLDNSLFLERNTINNKTFDYMNSNSKERENYEEAIRKKDLRNNFDFINRNYHKQLNLAFLKYNPDIYSINLKKLLQVSQAARDDISRTKLEVEGDIEAMNNKYKHIKILQKIKTTKNSRSKRIEYFEPNMYKVSENKNFFNSKKNLEMGIGNIPPKKKMQFLPSLGGDKIPGNKNNPRKSVFGMKLIKKESTKSLQIYDNQNDNGQRLLNISKEIENYIGNENINQKIDLQINDYNEHKFMSLFNENEDSVFKPKDHYFLKKKKINGMFGDLYIKKLKDKVKAEEKNFGDKLRMNKNDYFNKINNEMKTSLREFDDNMKKKILIFKKTKKMNNKYF